MTCGRCARDIETDSTFCRYCGAPVRQSEPATPRRLTRRPAEGKIGGVCAGIAAYFNADPTVVRLVWVLLSVVPGAIIGGLIAYAIAWILLPAESAPALLLTGPRRLHRSAADRKIAGVCGGLADYFGVDSTMVRIAAVVLAIWPGAIVCGILLYLLAWFVMPSAVPERLEPSPSTL
jgi:phage shock protein PspC (stress-responsive transcriptional regulator)